MTPDLEGEDPVSEESDDFTAHVAQAGETAAAEDVGPPAEDDDPADSDDDVEAHGSWGGIG
jgi:hypothetical protein